MKLLKASLSLPGAFSLIGEFPFVHTVERIVLFEQELLLWHGGRMLSDLPGASDPPLSNNARGSSACHKLPTGKLLVPSSFSLTP